MNSGLGLSRASISGLVALGASGYELEAFRASHFGVVFSGLDYIKAITWPNTPGFSSIFCSPPGFSALLDPIRVVFS